jgi:hypothetical protein
VQTDSRFSFWQFGFLAEFPPPRNFGGKEYGNIHHLTSSLIKIFSAKEF